MSEQRWENEPWKRAHKKSYGAVVPGLGLGRARRRDRIGPYVSEPYKDANRRFNRMVRPEPSAVPKAGNPLAGRSVFHAHLLEKHARVSRLVNVLNGRKGAERYGFGHEKVSHSLEGEEAYNKYKKDMKGRKNLYMGDGSKFDPDSDAKEPVSESPPPPPPQFEIPQGAVAGDVHSDWVTTWRKSAEAVYSAERTLRGHEDLNVAEEGKVHEHADAAHKKLMEFEKKNGIMSVALLDGKNELDISSVRDFINMAIVKMDGKPKALIVHFEDTKKDAEKLKEFKKKVDARHWSESNLRVLYHEHGGHFRIRDLSGRPNSFQTYMLGGGSSS